MRASALVSLVLLGGIATACSSDPTPQSPPPLAEADTGGKSQAAAAGMVEIALQAVEEGLVRVEPVRPEIWPEVLEIPGQVRRNEDRTMRVGSLVEGRVVEVSGAVGKRVEAGEVLARLRSVTVDDLRAQLAQAVAELERCQAMVELARTAWERTVRLVELRVGSVQERQQAEAELHRAQAELRVAEAEVARLQENLEHLGVSPEGAEEEYSLGGDSERGHHAEMELVPVQAPISGTVVERLITLGSVVSPADDLFVVSDLSLVWVDAAVPERSLPRIRVGQRVRVRGEGMAAKEVNGRLSYIADELEPVTRTAQMRCEVPNREGFLRPGLFVRVALEVEEDHQVLAVPAKALQELNGESVVFVDRGGGRFEVRRVETGLARQDLVQIRRGLEAGESVAVEGSFLLKSQVLRSELEEE